MIVIFSSMLSDINKALESRKEANGLSARTGICIQSLSMYWSLPLFESYSTHSSSIQYDP